MIRSKIGGYRLRTLNRNIALLKVAVLSESPSRRLQCKATSDKLPMFTRPDDFPCSYLIWLSRTHLIPQRAYLHLRHDVDSFTERPQDSEEMAGSNPGL
jgi:hypothetical protein